MAGHTWLKPIELSPNAAGAWPAVSGRLEHEYDARWYVIRGAHLGSGDDLTVTLRLNGGTADLTLLGFTDIRAAALKLVAQLQSGSGLLDADDMDSDDMDSDDMDSDDMDSDDMDSDDMDSDDMDSDDMDSDDMDSDDMASDLGMWQGTERDTFAEVYASAQRHALRSASVTPGPADEQIHTVVRAGGQDLYFRVRGHHGEFDPVHRFALSVVIEPSTACVNVDACPRWSPVPGDVLCGQHQTLILTNSARASLALPDEPARLMFLQRLARLAEAVDGVVYDLRADAALSGLYRTWDVDGRECVPFANVIVDSVRQIVAQFAACNPLRYVVLVGGDDVIPFGRIEDRAEISREWQWAGPYDAHTPLGAALTYGFYLSDDVYGRAGGPIDLRGKNVRPPTFATGRLVESAADITAYLDQVSPAGLITIHLDSALVSGYGFVRDLADEIAARMASAGAAVRPLISDSWTTPDLAAALNVPPRLIAAQGHYSAHTLVPAAQDTPRLLPTDPAIANADLAGRLWMTIGCHSGHNVVDREARAAYPYPKSWAEALLAKGATLVGGTGYQYGESELLANSEQLYAFLTEELIRSRTVAVGEALIAAKRRYLEQKLPVKGIEQKLVEVATLYGLPMITVSVTKAVAPDGPFVVARDPVVKDGRGRARTVTFTFAPKSEDALDGDPTRFFANNPFIARPLRPVLPGLFRDISAEDAVPIGVLWTGGTYHERPHSPLVAVPVIERKIEEAKRPRYRNRAFLPARPFRLVRGAGPRRTFAFAPMQYRYGPTETTEGVRRLWERATFEIYYARPGDPGMALDAPALHMPRISIVGDDAEVSVTVRSFAPAERPLRVCASYLDGARLRTVDLQGAGEWVEDGLSVTRTFRTTIPRFARLRDDLRRVSFQAVGANGRVASLSNGGQLFGRARASQRRATIQLRARSSVQYRERVRARATLTDHEGPIGGADVLFRIGRSRVWVKTDARGRAAATLNIACRPRGSTYLLTASFPGDDRHRGRAASMDVKIGKAATTWLPVGRSGNVRLGRSKRVHVATLALARSHDRTLGARAVIVHGKEDRIVYTDADGKLRLEPSELVAPGTVTVEFPEDDRYRSAATRLTLTWSERASERAR